MAPGVLCPLVKSDKGKNKRRKHGVEWEERGKANMGRDVLHIFRPVQ